MDTLRFRLSALNVKVKKFNEVQASGGSDYDSPKAVFESIVTNWALLQRSHLLMVLLDTLCNVTKSISAPAQRCVGWPVQYPPVEFSSS